MSPLKTAAHLSTPPSSRASPGGVAQGIGAVLLERSAYGEDGNFQSATFMDYLMPTACDVPRIEIEHLQTVPLDADVNSAAWAKAA